MTMPQTSPEVAGMGHSMKRKEDGRFIRGKGNYVDDVVLPDMLFMDIVRSPYPHAKILNIDASRALAEFGWQSTTSFPDGLRKTVDWYRGVRQPAGSVYTPATP